MDAPRIGLLSTVPSDANAQFGQALQAANANGGEFPRKFLRLVMTTFSFSRRNIQSTITRYTHRSVHQPEWCTGSFCHKSTFQLFAIGSYNIITCSSINAIPCSSFVNMFIAYLFHSAGLRSRCCIMINDYAFDSFAVHLPYVY